MAAKALILDLGDIHESYSVVRSLWRESDHERRIDGVITDWAAYVAERLPDAARTELEFLLRHEHAPAEVIERVAAARFDVANSAAILNIRKAAPTGRTRLRAIVGEAVLGAETPDHWKGQPLRDALAEHYRKLEALALSRPPPLPAHVP